MRTALVLVVGYVPFGLAVGATVAGRGIDPVTGWFSSLPLLGGMLVWWSLVALPGA